LRPQPHGDGRHQHQEQPRMPEEEARQIGLAAIEEAAHEEGEAGGEGEKYDQEYRRDRGREVGGEFPPEHEQGRAHDQFSAPLVIWRNTSSRLARLTNISATAMSDRPRMPASSAAVGRLCGAWTRSRVTPLTRSAT